MANVTIRLGDVSGRPASARRNCLALFDAGRLTPEKLAAYWGIMDHTDLPAEFLAFAAEALKVTPEELRADGSARDTARAERAAKARVKLAAVARATEEN